MLCFDLYRVVGKKWRAIQWTFVWILSAVKNIAPLILIIRIGKEIWQIPKILVESDHWESSPNALRDQSMCTFPVFCNISIYKHVEYFDLSTLHGEWLGMNNLACPVSPFRKSIKKRSHSSSSSSSSSSESQKEDSLPDKSDPKDKGFNRARLGQVESPGSAERGRPHGGFVSLTTYVWLIKENSSQRMVWLVSSAVYQWILIHFFIFIKL